MLGRERERNIIHKVFSVLLIFREMAIRWPYSGELLTYHLKLLRCTSLPEQVGTIYTRAR